MNVFNEFKTHMGSINNTNQFIELFYRVFKEEHGDAVDNQKKMKELSKLYGLNLSNCDGLLIRNIPSYYIIYIHTVFDSFLDAIKDLDAFPLKSHSKPEKKNKLEWMLNELGFSDDPEIRVLYDICNYYRLVRNHLIHCVGLEPNSEFRTAQARFQSYLGNNLFFDSLRKKKDLSNQIEALSFDDQVFFSETAQLLAERIYKDCNYIYLNHIMSNRETLAKSINFLKNNDRRMKDVLFRKLKDVYPITHDTFDSIADSLLAEIVL